MYPLAVESPAHYVEAGGPVKLALLRPVQAGRRASAGRAVRRCVRADEG